MILYSSPGRRITSATIAPSLSHWKRMGFPNVWSHSVPSMRPIDAFCTASRSMMMNGSWRSAVNMYHASENPLSVLSLMSLHTPEFHDFGGCARHTRLNPSFFSVQRYTRFTPPVSTTNLRFVIFEMAGSAPEEDRLWLARHAPLVRGDHRRCNCHVRKEQHAVELASGQTAVVCSACMPPATFAHWRACAVCGLRLGHGRPAVVVIDKERYRLCRQHALNGRAELLRRLELRKERRKVRKVIADQ